MRAAIPYGLVGAACAAGGGPCAPGTIRSGERGVGEGRDAAPGADAGPETVGDAAPDEAGEPGPDAAADAGGDPPADVDGDGHDGTETVDPGASIGREASLALDADGAAHVAYRSETEGDLRFASDASGAWEIEVVDDSDDTGEWASLAAGAGALHVVYQDVADGDIRHATRAVPNGVDDDCDGIAF